MKSAMILRRTQCSARNAIQQCSSSRRAASYLATQHISKSITTRTQSRRIQSQEFSTSSWHSLGLTPDSEDPKPPQTESSSEGHKAAADLTDAEFHEIADQYLNTLVLTLEEMADSEAEKGLEVEYSAGVLTISHPNKGDYVLNKQPPNKQIWLSSPVSGPKRFDWVAATEGGMHSKQDTEGTTGDVGDDGRLGGGKWTYLRDNTELSEILKDELSVTLAHENESDVTSGREGPGSSGAAGAVEG